MVAQPVDVEVSARYSCTRLDLRYGKLRKEPRRDGLATIEAAAIMLANLEGRPDIETTLLASFEGMLTKYQEVQARMPELAPGPKRRRKSAPARLTGRLAPEPSNYRSSRTGRE